MSEYTASNGVKVVPGYTAALVVMDQTIPNSVIASDAHLKALREYFNAHPEPSPLEKALPGEIWLLTTPDEDDVPAITTSSENGHVILTAATHEAGGTQEFSLTSVYITNARRIWPEGDAS